ncbi:MAG: HAD-IG family 5'-nucleotidase [Candidatus Krumholzibacteria bacterium]|jgi:HAD superfamily 5'-nucleotidase-like hydrolase|nr:HAD-IG family 5'-nucleotidase [Candidatus Krumholzibacteria bacterium]MDP6670151.1 HAD-IG family 5'-nucleotidase [Candidatus Krumholzibacteria bacterium]MDP6797005.1 HAD-IG family 5'-nucleotidase [Candidatus Krumholzibacteria bacterium]MDP7022407.1 HAD-IG family 5'-nucleotidase [Candidatus Krumholzibacteria bacterium]
MNQKTNRKTLSKVTRTHRYEQFIPREKRIYVNRNLRMGSIRWVGFDMDHTLALYNRNFIEALAFDLARDALIRERKYPDFLRDILYDPDFGIRGLIVDKDEGNILKVDQFSYVAKAFHGRKELDRNERKKIYSARTQPLASDRFWSSDTLFGLPEVSLYACSVEAMERELGKVDYRKLFDDIRYSVDLVHRDGSLKRIILERMGECFLKDPGLLPTLEKFRLEGKRLFLLTNSDYEYTSRVLSHVLSDPLRGSSWWDYFDLLVVESRKPGFFKGRLRWKPVDHGEHPVPTFAGGNYRRLEQEIGAIGDEILYLGDHIFGDILRSKKTGGWRTGMVVEELEHEILSAMKAEDNQEELDQIQDDNSRVLLRLEAVRTRKLELRNRKLSEYRSLDEAQMREMDLELQEVGALERELEEELSSKLMIIRALEEEAQNRYNAYWGSLCKVDSEISRFGSQMRDYACTYTSRVSNFLAYPPDKYFRSPEEFMPHEI